ncbi:MAG: cytochrome b [Lautropia sp.]
MQRSSAPLEPTQVYSRTARVLHWSTVALLALQFPVGFAMTYRGNTLNLWDALTNAMYSGHKLGGIVILLVVLLRLLYRTTQGAPADEPTIEPWQRFVSHLTHWALYGLLLAAPLAGYIGISMFPALDIFGLFKLPAVAAPDKDAAQTAFLVHAWLVLLLAALIAMHVAAALYHYVVRKDDVLGRMIPGLLRRSRVEALVRPRPR